MDSKKVIQFPIKLNEEMLDVGEWGWEEFKCLFEAIAPIEGEERAWKTIHAIWQIRAGENVDQELEVEITSKLQE